MKPKVMFKLSLIRIFFSLSLMMLAMGSCQSQDIPNQIAMGDEQVEAYLPLLQNKKVALLTNQSATINNVHLVDTLRALGINIVKVFAPEHGFRGNKSDGAKVESGYDQQSGVVVLSMYGKNKELPAQLLSDVDVLIFDIQDVGVRFFTFISAMYYAMESCAQSNTKFIVLDRPNPNGMYVAGPMLDSAYSSYVGLLPIPVVHGLTVGELAQMINGENWLKSEKCDLTVVPVIGYTHRNQYAPNVPPSPNLPTAKSVWLYPTLALFEGTEISVGRGTSTPFLQIGHPSFTDLPYSFTPESIPGVSKYPPHENEKCYGISFKETAFKPHFTLKYLIEFYQKFENKDKYFNAYFNKLIGNGETMQMIRAGKSEEEIKKTWQSDLENYKTMRKKYLLYEDFE